jgi:DnaD/phage-associated family protein
MSAIFETEFPEYLDNGEGGKTRASTAKLVLLAIADHANDEGESAYPGLTRLELKTGLSRQGVVDTLKTLRHNGLITVSETPSRMGTNNYSINLGSFPSLVKPLDQSSHLTSTSQATLPALVKPLDLNHPLTIIQPSTTTTTAKTSQIFKVYEQEIGPLTPIISQEIGGYIDDPKLPDEYIADAIHEAARQNKRNWAYVRAILNRWMVEGKQVTVKLPSGPKYPQASSPGASRAATRQAANLAAIEQGMKMLEGSSRNG